MAANNSLPLAGQRIVVTRALEQARASVEELEKLGATVLLFPAVAFNDPEDWVPLDRAIRDLATFDWLLFTSQNAVRFFCARFRALGFDWISSTARLPRVAVVGPATAEAAREQGLRVVHIAARYRAEILAEELRTEVAGRKVLLPRSDRARNDLPASLRAAGATVVEVVAYRTSARKLPEGDVFAQVARGEVDVVTFASPSAFQRFAEALGPEPLQKLSRNCAFATIGPVTARAIREAGFSVAVEAEEATSAGLAAALANYFLQRAPALRPALPRALG